MQTKKKKKEKKKKKKKKKKKYFKNKFQEFIKTIKSKNSEKKKIGVVFFKIYKKLENLNWQLKFINLWNQIFSKILDFLFEKKYFEKINKIKKLIFSFINFFPKTFEKFSRLFFPFFLIINQSEECKKLIFEDLYVEFQKIYFFLKCKERLKLVKILKKNLPFLKKMRNNKGFIFNGYEKPIGEKIDKQNEEKSNKKNEENKMVINLINNEKKTKVINLINDEKKEEVNKTKVINLENYEKKEEEKTKIINLKIDEQNLKEKNQKINVKSEKNKNTFFKKICNKYSKEVKDIKKLTNLYPYCLYVKSKLDNNYFVNLNKLYFQNLIDKKKKKLVKLQKKINL